MAEPIAERFYSKVEYIPGIACHLWIGAFARRGYGRLWNGRPRGDGFRMLIAHRIAWELSNGPIPNGLLVCHKCDNPPCVNPAHLFLGTNKDNLLDAYRKGRLDHALASAHAGIRKTKNRATHCRNGHPFNELNTKSYRGYRYCGECNRIRSNNRNRRILRNV